MISSRALMGSALLAFAALTAGLPRAALATELGVLAPVMEDGQPLKRTAPDGKPAPVVTRVRSGELYARLQREARDGFTAQVLAIDEAAQIAAGATEAATVWLYLSLEDGGFPRYGFWLRNGDDERYLPDPFVDLIVDDNSVDNGDFEEIFAHELGHVMLHRLIPRFPLGYSRTPHASLAITDTPTAFDEGFATHMQGLVRQFTRNERLRRTDRGFDAKPFVSAWQSNLDRIGRIDGVRRNQFVLSQVPLPGEHDPIASRDNSTLFDTARLKTGDQMMASEGVIATVFYRWLVPGEASNTALAERYGRVFESLAVLGRNELSSDTPILVRLLRSYAGLHPDQGAETMRVFLETTYAATVDPSVSRLYEATAARGRVGDMASFVAQLKPAREEMARIVEETIRTPARLDAALSPPIWLYADLNAKVDKEKTEPVKPRPVAYNLNTAEREHLAALPGIGDALAAKIVVDRRLHGGYASLANVAERMKLSGKTVAALAELNEAAQTAGTFGRE